MGTSCERITFDNRRNRDFGKAVKKRVDAYFDRQGLSRHANASMVIKTAVLLSLYVGSYGLIISGILPLGALWAMCAVLGVAMAGIGFSIGHDALHGAYSSDKRVNKVLGLSFDLVGANGYMWNFIHNVIHHTYTNIDGHDKDLMIAPFIRLSPHSKYRPIHRLQHILAFVAYSFATLFWVFIKDYRGFLQRDVGPYRDKQHPLSAWAVLLLSKVFYYGYTIVVPLLVLDVTWWQFLVGYLTFHLTAGLILGVVFQLAHVVEETEYPLANTDAQIEEHWLIHQMRTTANFTKAHPLISWYVGGLNYQIEHHLFPRICSVHYPALAPIVRETAEEFGLPYIDHGTFRGALGSHYRMLKRFGQGP